MSITFIPLLFGGDINVYSVARAFHEAYGVRSVCYGKFPSGPAHESAIIDYRACPENETPAAFLQNVEQVSREFADRTVLLIGCGDSYVKLAADHLGRYPQNVIAPYVSGDQISQLTHKEQFYKLCEAHGLDYPATFVYRRELGRDFTLPFRPPFICKPSNGVEYWAHPFPGNEKVFKCKDKEELLSVLDKVYASGYSDSMIIQDFIPGDDTYMHVMTNYSDRHGQVKMMCLGHVLLEEHSPHGIGNHAVILTEVNEALCQKIKGFLEAIGFRGFSNFDIKYDQRDGKFKVFELNCRQGRSNYYVTGAGYNIAAYLVDDLVEQKELPFVMADQKSLWQVVSRKVVFDYIVPEYHQEMQEQIVQGRACNPLFYEKDKGFKRRLRMYRSLMLQTKNFKKYGHRIER